MAQVVAQVAQVVAQVAQVVQVHQVRASAQIFHQRIFLAVCSRLKLNIVAQKYAEKKS